MSYSAKKRVVVTGLGMLSPVGGDVSSSWAAIKESRSGISPITSFDCSGLPVRIAGEFKGDLAHISSRMKRRMDRFIQLGFSAACEAVVDSGIDALSEEIRSNVGVLIGSGIGGLTTIRDNIRAFDAAGYKKVSPFFIPSALINMCAAHVSIEYGFCGPNSAVSSACASGTHTIGDAMRMIKYGDADIMVAGGAESSIIDIGVAGFNSLNALSTKYNESPEEASRPWDAGRDGFVLGEGAGVVVLEEYEHARRRGAKIYCELIGYGLAGDAFHITAPANDSRGAVRSIQGALRDAECSPADIDYINAHATSTPLGDVLELNAVYKVFGDKNVYMSSVKSSIGHLLGAAGSVEAIFTIMSIIEGVLPPTLNLHGSDCETNIDLVPQTAKEREINIALSNSFGFGGTNASIIFKAV